MYRSLKTHSRLALDVTKFAHVKLGIYELGHDKVICTSNWTIYRHANIYKHIYLYKGGVVHVSASLVFSFEG